MKKNSALSGNCNTIATLKKDDCDEFSELGKGGICAMMRAMKRVFQSMILRRNWDYGGLILAAGLCGSGLIAGGFVAASAQDAASLPAPKAPAVDAARFAEARKTFTGICAACHGTDGHGGERGPDIASRAVAGRTDERLFRTVKNGISETGMPNFAYLGDQKIEAIVAVLRALQGNSAPLPMPGNAESGEKLFQREARCGQCHMADGLGGFIADDLTGFAAGLSPADIRRAILTPPRNERRHGREGGGGGNVIVTLADGTSLNGALRNEDNFSLQIQSDDGAFHLVQKADVAKVKMTEPGVGHAEYGKSLSAKQMDDLVSYLMKVAEKEELKTPKKKVQQEEEQ
jgi:cytochrome c oxidase cbb3-type subunit III